MSSPPHISGFSTPHSIQPLLVHTNPRLKSHVTVTQEMSPQRKRKIFKNKILKFASILHLLTVGLKFNLSVRFKGESLQSCAPDLLHFA